MICSGVPVQIILLQKKWIYSKFTKYFDTFCD